MESQSPRLDRIEKDLEAFFKGMAELRAAQLKTDEQISELRAAQLKTDEQISELRAAQLKTDEQQRKTDEQISELRAAQLKTDEQLKKTDEQLKKTDEKLNKVSKQMAEIGFVQGEVAEDVFYRNTKTLFQKRGMRFPKVVRNLKKKGLAEYDIVAAGGDDVLVIEVKNKLTARMVDKFIEKKLPKFKIFFPEYQNLRLRGGVGALVMKDDVGRYAEKAGLFVLTQADDGGAALLNGEDFVPKAFG